MEAGNRPATGVRAGENGRYGFWGEGGTTTKMGGGKDGLALRSSCGRALGTHAFLGVHVLEDADDEGIFAVVVCDVQTSHPRLYAVEI